MNLRAGCFVVVLWIQFFQSTPIFGEDPRHSFFKACLQAIKARSYGPMTSKVFRNWVEEVTIVMKDIVGATKNEVNIDVISAVYRMLQTPDEALAMIRRQRIDSIDVSMIQFLRNYAKGEKAAHGMSEIYGEMTPVIVPAPSLEIQRLFSESHLKGYYRSKIESLLLDIEVEPIFQEYPGSIQDLDEVMDALKKLFFKPLRPISKIVPTEAEVAIMKSEFLNDKTKQIDRVIQTFRRKIEDMGRRKVKNTYLIFELQKGLRKLENLSKYVKQYSSVLIFRGVYDEKDFLWAQIQFGDLEAKKIAFHLLLSRLDREGAVLSRLELREILAHPDSHFRGYVIDVFRGRGSFSAEAIHGADAELMRSLNFFPGDRPFEESVETMALLLTVPPHMEIALEKAWVFSQETIERIAIVRALGHLETEEAFGILVAHGSEAMAHPRIIRAYVEEIVGGLRLFSERLEEGKRVLDEMIKSTDAMIRKEGIRGLGMVLGGDDPIFLGLLAKERDPLVQANLLILISSTPDEVVGPIGALEFALKELSSTNMNLKAAASLYLVRKGGTGPSVEKGLGGLLEILGSDVLPTEDILILLLRELKESFLDSEKVRSYLRVFSRWIWETKRSREVCIEALSILAKMKDLESAQMLLNIFDGVSGALKRRVIDLLISNYDDKDILKKTFRRIIEFYEDSRYEFDFFSGMDCETLFFKKIVLFGGDPEIAELIGSLRTSTKISFRLQHFVDEVSLVLMHP